MADILFVQFWNGRDHKQTAFNHLWYSSPQCICIILTTFSPVGGMLSIQAMTAQVTDHLMIPPAFTIWIPDLSSISIPFVPCCSLACILPIDWLSWRTRRALQARTCTGTSWRHPTTKIYILKGIWITDMSDFQAVETVCYSHHQF